MCGITGAFGYVDGPTLDTMLEKLVHRGPDESGRYVSDEDGVMLGARRLSIVDLEGGSQPIWNEDETVCVSFNGEIYNHESLREDLQDEGHRFSSRCDTEVLVHLWEEHGPDLVTHIDGMFAFAIWDETRNSVFLARDRMGIKPLYYSQHDGGILWASELPALLAAGVDNAIDRSALNEYLALSHVTAPRTIVESIRKVPPGSMAMIDDSGLSIDRYYWPSAAASQPKSIDSITSTVRSQLESAVEKRLMADVPVGAFLSGGLDSSSVVGIMSDKTDNDVSTYSIEFADSSYNETEYANAVAAEFGTDHDVISTDLSDLDIFEEIVSRMNEPMPDPAILPTTLLASEAATDLKVVQTGSGGDEMFSGYDQWNMIGKHRRWFDSIPGPVFAAAGTMADVSPVYDDHLHYFSSLNDDSRAITNFLTGESFTQSCNTLDWLTFNGDTNITSPETTVREHLTEPNRGSEECVYQFLTGAHLPSRLLHKVDTATMNASLEARVPFLDRDLVEVAMVIPHSVKTDGDYKPVLRKAVEDFVPSVVLKRDKKGFSVPVSEWIEDRRDPIERWISEEKLYATPYVDTEQVRTAYAEHYRGTKSHSRMLFRVLVYVAWYHTVVKPTESSIVKLSP